MPNSKRLRPRRSWWTPRRIFRRRPYAAEGLSVNDDFTDRVTDVPTLLERRRPLFVGVQEGKRTDYARAVTHRVGWPYALRQDLTSDARAGVAVLWDVTRARAIGTGVDDPDRLGGGWLELTPAGSGLLARGVAWQDVAVRLGPLGLFRRARVRVAAAHRPPQRDRHLWPLFDARLAAWCKDSPHRVVVFMDCNEAGGPDQLVKASGLSWYGVHFDGALTDLTVPGPAVALDRGSSDHKPVSIPFEI